MIFLSFSYINYKDMTLRVMHINHQEQPQQIICISPPDISLKVILSFSLILYVLNDS
jgi:hypothetical protein